MMMMIFLSAFLSFCALEQVGFLLRIFFMYNRFSLIPIDSQGTLRLALGLVGIDLSAASLWAITKF